MSASKHYRTKKTREESREMLDLAERLFRLTYEEHEYRYFRMDSHCSSTFVLMPGQSKSTTINLAQQTGKTPLTVMVNTPLEFLKHLRVQRDKREMLCLENNTGLPLHEVSLPVTLDRVQFTMRLHTTTSHKNVLTHIVNSLRPLVAGDIAKPVIDKLFQQCSALFQGATEVVEQSSGPGQELFMFTVDLRRGAAQKAAPLPELFKFHGEYDHLVVTADKKQETANLYLFLKYGTAQHLGEAMLFTLKARYAALALGGDLFANKEEPDSMVYVRLGLKDGTAQHVGRFDGDAQKARFATLVLGDGKKNVEHLEPTGLLDTGFPPPSADSMVTMLLKVESHSESLASAGRLLVAIQSAALTREGELSVSGSAETLVNAKKRRIGQ